METKELRQLGEQELLSRVKQLKEELFRFKFKQQTAEARDTSSPRKLRRNVARTLTVLNEKLREKAAK